ncbi:MAG TPA: outer membrane beta-barrel family protein [Bacteroidales bacterium]|nr:outer membrane beta-barrel family protein [Bacteroidales bacterium]
MKKLIVLSLLFVLGVLAIAQKIPTREYQIKGLVIDSKGFSVPFANVLLYNIPDSVTTKGTTTDGEGRFEITATQGNYYVKISFLSYLTKIISDIKIINSGIVLDKIVLTEDSQMLNEVVITGQRSQLQLNLDKKVFNVGSDITNLGGSAADVLNNVPSVSVEMDGSVSLRGSQNVRILIDGKPSGLVASSNALRLLQGDIIEKIEVITNPSARYDAAGEVGIINIVLKKNKNKGLNGVFTANTGYPLYYGGSYSINYRKNKLNIFSNYGMSYRTDPGKENTYQRYSGVDTSFIFNENATSLRSGLSNNITLGSDYYFSEKSILTASFLYENAREKNSRKIVYTDYAGDNTYIQSTRREETEKASENNFEAALSYKKKFERKDQELTMDFKWMQTTEPNKADIKQYNAIGLNDLNERSGRSEDEYNYLLQADYIHPFLNNIKLETGVKGNLRIVNSNYFFERQDNSLNWISLPAYVNNLVYNEKIYAAYLMSSYEFNRISVQAGLRGEYSDITTELTKTVETNHRTYLDLFPSANISYKLNEDNTMQISYSRRLNRPDFRELMPYEGFGDSRILEQGNPDLNPEYTNSYEVGYFMDREKLNFLSTIYYRHRTGVIQEFSSVDSVGITHIMPINLSVQNAYGLELNVSYEPGRNLRLNSSFNFYKALTEGSFNQKDFSSKTYSWTNRSSLALKLFDNDFQTTLNYRAPRVTPQGKNLSTWFVDFGITREVFKGKGSLAFNVRDVFNSRKRRSIIDSEGLYSRSENQFRSRQFVLTLTFRLNKDAKSKEDDRREDNGYEPEI